MKAKRIIKTTLAGMLLVAVAGATSSAFANPTGNGRIARGHLEVQVVPVDEVTVAPKLVRRPLDDRVPQVSVWTNPQTGTMVYPGQDMTVRVQVDRDAYVVVYDIDTRGRARLLYPDRPGDDGYVRSGRVKRIPGRQAGYRLMVTGPPGVERIVALASDRPLVHRWRRFAEDDLASADGRYGEGDLRYSDDAGVRASIRIGDADDGFSAVIAAGSGRPQVVRRPISPRLVPVPRGRADVSRDETWFRVGRRWRW